MSAVVQPNADLQLQAISTVPIFELVTFPQAVQNGLPADWPRRPGEARRSATGCAQILSIAADRWLILDPRHGEITAAWAALSAAGSITDVTGKWCEYRLSGKAAARLLANSVDTDDLLRERDCARTALFDCPGVLYRHNGVFSIWIERSYQSAFALAVRQAIGAQAKIA